MAVEEGLERQTGLVGLVTRQMLQETTLKRQMAANQGAAKKDGEKHLCVAMAAAATDWPALPSWARRF